MKLLKSLGILPLAVTGAIGVIGACAALYLKKATSSAKVKAKTILNEQAKIIEESVDKTEEIDEGTKVANSTESNIQQESSIEIPK